VSLLLIGPTTVDRRLPGAQEHVMSTTPSQLDPRGPQFNAIVTSVVLALVLITAPDTTGLVLLTIQVALFAVGAGLGVQRTPAAWVFRRLVRPQLAAPTHLEDPQPPRFAQAVGLVFTAVALLGYLSGLTLLGAIATGAALVAALLNAAFGLCLGCEAYLLLRRLRPTSARSDERTDLHTTV
jgi:hypothetical protein